MPSRSRVDVIRPHARIRLRYCLDHLSGRLGFAKLNKAVDSVAPGADRRGEAALSVATGVPAPEVDCPLRHVSSVVARAPPIKSSSGELFIAIIDTVKRARPFIISGVITATVMTVLSFFIEDTAQAKGTLVSGLIAGITIAAIPIYDIPHWSLLKRSTVHFIAMAFTVLPLLLWSGWFSPVISVAVFLLFGLVGWTIGYVANSLALRLNRK